MGMFHLLWCRWGSDANRKVCDKAQQLINSIQKDLICPSTSQHSPRARAIPSLSLGFRNLFLGLVLSVTLPVNSADLTSVC